MAVPRTELLRELRDKATIQCASLSIRVNGSFNDLFWSSLRLGHTSKEYQEFIDSIDVNGYVMDDSYVWLADGSWLEVENTEWKYRKYPSIPESLCS